MYLYDININIYYIFNIHTYIYIWIPQFWYYRLFPFILQTSNYSVSHQMVMSFSCLKVIWAWSRFNNKTNSEFCNILHIPHFLLMLVNYYSEKKSNNSASSPRAPTPPAAESRCTFQLNLPGRSSGGPTLPTLAETFSYISWPLTCPSPNPLYSREYMGISHFSLLSKEVKSSYLNVLCLYKRKIRL